MSRFIIDKFESLATNIDYANRPSNLHEGMKNIVLDSNGYAKKRTGMTNVLTAEKQIELTGDKHGLVFFNGKVGTCEFDEDTQGETIKKFTDNYIPLTNSNNNFNAYSNIPTFDHNEIFDKDIDTTILNAKTAVFINQGELLGEFNQILHFVLLVNGNEIREINLNISEDILSSNILDVSYYNNLPDLPAIVTISSVSNISTGESISLSLFKMEFLENEGWRSKYSIETLELTTLDTEKLEENGNISISLDSTIRIWKYQLQATNDNNLMLDAWILQGSDNGLDWYDLDTQTGQLFNGKEIKEYEINLNGNEYTDGYNIYRITFSEIPDFISIKYFNIFRATLTIEAGEIITSSDIDNYIDPNFNSPRKEITVAVLGANINIIETNDDSLDIGSLLYDNVKTGEKISGVQFRNDLIIPTGNKLIRIRFAINTLTDKLVYITDELDKEIYEPTIIENLVIGGNIFNPNYPSGSAIVLSALKNVINNIIALNITGSLSQPSVFIPYFFTTANDLLDVQFKWFFKKNDEEFPNEADSVTEANSSGGKLVWHFESLGIYNIKIVMETVGADTVTKIIAYNVDDTVYNELEYDDENKIYVSKFDYNINECTKAIISYNKLLLYGNGTETIYTSVVNNPAYYAASGVLTLEDNYASPILDIVPFKQLLLVFTNRSITGISGAGDLFDTGNSEFSPYVLDTLDTGVGIVSDQAAIAIENSVVFISKDGIYNVDQVSISEKRIELTQVDEVINNISAKSMTTNQLVGSCVGYFDKRVYFSFPNFDNDLIDEVGRLLIWDLGSELKGWTEFNSQETNIIYFINNNSKMYMLNNNQNILTKNDEVSILDYSLEAPQQGLFEDNRQLYSFELKTSKLSLGGRFKNKQINMLKVHYSNTYKIETDLRVELYMETIKLISKESEVSTATSSREFNFGDIFNGNQFGAKDRDIFVISSREFSNTIGNNGKNPYVIVSNKQDAPFFITHVEVEYTLLNDEGINAGGSGLNDK